MTRTPSAPTDPLPLDRTAPLEDLERVERVVLSRGDAVENLDWLAFMFYTHGRLEKARGYYERLVQREPANASFRYYLGDLLHKVGERDAARAQFDQVVSLDREGQYAQAAKAKLTAAR